MKEGAYKNYLLIVLTVIFAFNTMDRLVLGMLLQNIKIDLHLSDGQLGFLTGLAFALFYVGMGIPLARWADRGNRVVIISLTTALWSSAVVICGAARSFWQLLIFRIGAAVGEAGCVPPAHSLIAEYFDRARRPRAFSHYMLAIPLSALIGYFGAGWLNQLYGWRATFVILGSPGIVIAILAHFTLREPRRSISTRTYSANESRTTPSLGEVFAVLWSSCSFRNLLLAYSSMSFFGYGIQQWLPAFCERSFGLTTGELGTWLTLIGGGCGLVGTYFGGVLSVRLAAGNESRQLKGVAIAYSLYAAISMIAYLSHSYHVAFALLGLAAVAITTTGAPFFATIQTLAPTRMRAMSIAIVYLAGNLAAGLGPLVAGALSDALQPWAGNESLRYALVALWPGYLWSSWHLWRAAKTISKDIQSKPPEPDDETSRFEAAAINELPSGGTMVARQQY